MKRAIFAAAFPVMVFQAQAHALPVASSSDCDSHYQGVCVPIASDVDCAGGNGNGPAYFPGPAAYEGTDPYGLDRDRDGILCEPNPER